MSVNKRSKLTLKWKIFAFLLGFCAILLVILWLFQTVLLDAFYRRIMVSEIKSNAGTIEKNVDNENLQELISSISQNGSGGIEILTLDGYELYASDNLRFSGLGKILYIEKMQLVTDAVAQNGEILEYYSDIPISSHELNSGFVGKMPMDKNMPVQSLLYVKIIQTSSGDSVAILLNSQISPVNATVTTLRYQLYLITAVMILLAVFLALMIARRVSKPIEDINKSAKELAKGKYDIEFNGTGFREISELSDTLNTAAADLSKVEGLRRELMANISHDLRTPLALIYSYAEVMHDFPDEIAANQTQIIMDETQRLTSLVNDILDIAKLESGNQDLNITEYNLTKSIEGTTKRLAELIKKEDYSVTFNFERSATVQADETKITQAYYNLLLNAVHYTGSDKSIIVRQILTEDTVRIEVSDTGEGVAADEQPYIWDRYYKADKKHRRAVTGTGLGLSIVKKVMQMHGGDCGVESVTGEGSTFWFSLKTEG
jgi:signal transduction histidine kinase